MDIKVFAERLKTARSERNITATELAEALGINKATIYRYENAEIGRIKSVTINAIADYLNVNPDYLIGATDNKRTAKEAEDLLSSITDAEKSLLELFRRVPEDRRQMVLEMIRIALKQSQ